MCAWALTAGRGCARRPYKPPAEYQPLATAAHARLKEVRGGMALPAAVAIPRVAGLPQLLMHRCALLQEAFVNELEVRGGMTLPAAVANAHAARLPLMRCCGAAQAAAAVQEAAEQQEAAVE